MASDLCEYELERAANIARNKAMMEKLSLVRQIKIVESFKPVKKPMQDCKQRMRKMLSIVQPRLKRRSKRLLGEVAMPGHIANDNDGVAEHSGDEDGLIDLIDRRRSCSQAEASGSEEADGHSAPTRCCTADLRGGPYDSTLGLTCHFCRQKRLCAMSDCPRCRQRNAGAECIGKSSCSRCHSATGVHCSGCLLVRYGETLGSARAEDWLCPHCYEAENPGAGWFCNSSFCMKRRGHKATGIAIYVAQANGFSSVAHYLQDQTLKHKKEQLAVAQKVASAAGEKCTFDGTDTLEMSSADESDNTTGPGGLVAPASKKPTTMPAGAVRRSTRCALQTRVVA